MLPWLEKEAKRRQGTRTDIKANLPESEQGQSRDKAAKLFGISGRIVSDAKMIKDKAPEKYQQIKEGKKTVGRAKDEIKSLSV